MTTSLFMLTLWMCSNNRRTPNRLPTGATRTHCRNVTWLRSLSSVKPHQELHTESFCLMMANKGTNKHHMPYRSDQNMLNIFLWRPHTAQNPDCSSSKEIYHPDSGCSFHLKELLSKKLLCDSNHHWHFLVLVTEMSLNWDMNLSNTEESS